MDQPQLDFGNGGIALVLHAVSEITTPALAEDGGPGRGVLFALPGFHVLWIDLEDRGVGLPSFFRLFIGHVVLGQLVKVFGVVRAAAADGFECEGTQLGEVKLQRQIIEVLVGTGVEGILLKDVFFQVGDLFPGVFL